MREPVPVSEAEYLTARQAAQILNLSEYSTYELFRLGVIPVVRLAGKTVRVRKRDLQRWLDKGGSAKPPRGVLRRQKKAQRQPADAA